jgi:transcriptional regulator with XRE-family HTH domain
MTERWTAEDALLLQQLRQAAGLDTSQFAIESAISHAQLLQLENGGDTLFYSVAIKAHLGRKLIAKLQSRSR